MGVEAILPRRLPLRSIVFDVGLGLLLTPYLYLSHFGTQLEFDEPVLIYVVEGIAVAMRRMWPFLAAVLIVFVAGTSEVTRWPYPLGVGIVIYTLAALGAPRKFVWPYALFAAGLLILPSPYSPIERNAYTLTQIVPEAALVTIGPLFAGMYMRERQELITALSQRAAEADERRELEADRVRAEERTRLAGEIHDVVAHTVSLMVVHTGALTLAATDPRTRELAEHVRKAGTAALEELRDLVGVLRKGETAPLGPVPSIGNLPALLAESRAAGASVGFAESGIPGKCSGPVERTAYRLVQESLTNARKHAPGAPITVQLTWQRATVEISVHNGAAQRRDAGFPTSGHGLESLRERVNLLSGQFTAGPTADGGWTVTATLPLGGDA